MNRVRIRWVPAALVAAATLLVFLPALGNGFVNWDDDENFLWNPHYRGLGWANLRWMFTTAHHGPYVPMAWLTLGLDYSLWGMNPAGYHLTSVMLHAANAALLYMVAQRLLAFALAGGGGQRQSVRLGAAVAALFFSLHPLRVESVVWISERRDVVAGLFTLLVVLAYLKARPAETGKRVHGWYWAAVGAFGLALLSKSVVVGLPVVLVVMDIYPLGRLGPLGTLFPLGPRTPLRSSGPPAANRGPRLADLVLEKLPFAALSAAISAVTLGVFAQQGLLATSATMDISQRLAVSVYGLAFYLGRTIAPWPLSPIYTLFHPVVPWSARYLVPAALALLITAGAIVLAKRWPAGLAVWAAYGLLLGPVLGLLHNGPQIAADRYSYFSGIPLALLVGGGVSWCRRAAANGRVGPVLGPAAVAGMAVVLLGLSALTVRQIAVWHDSVALWRHAATVEPESDIPVFYLGWALDEAGRPDEARAHFTRTLPRVPATLPALRAQVLLHRGIVAQRIGDPAAAAADFRAALAIDPEHPVAQIRLAVALAAQGDAAGAHAGFARAVRLSPVWPRYQLWEIRAAVREVPPDQADPRRALGQALRALLERHGVREQAEVELRP